MDVQEIVERLKAAGDDPYDRALATLDIVLSDREPELRDAIEAAAVPHWFNREMLAQLVGSGDYLETLIQLPMVETFAARRGWNVHETTRLAIRRDLYNRQPDRFRELSAAAAKCVPGDSAHDRIETLYHQLSANPVEGGNELALHCAEWIDAGRFEALQALGQALDELLRYTPPAMPARARCAISLAWIVRPRVPLNQTEALLRETLQLVEDYADDHSETNARDLLGDILERRGLLPEALIEYRQAQAIRQRTAEQSPADVVSQCNLSLSYGRIGDIEAGQGDRAAALKSYQTGLAILERLESQDAGNTRWRRELSVTYSKIGDIEAAQGDRAAALKCYQAGLETLKSQDQDNTGWQRDLSVTYDRIGDVEAANGSVIAALTSYRASLEIRERLVRRDSGNTEWQRDLSISSNRIGRVEAKRGDLPAALASYRAAYVIAERIAKGDPKNLELQHDLSFCHWTLATTLENLNQFNEARVHAAKCLAVAERLAELDPNNTVWQNNVALARELVARLQAVQQ